jgi:pilus assembly protein Flp/PilA
LKAEETAVDTILLILKSKVQALVAGEQGQDLVEYALIVALVSLAAVAGLSGLAASINGVFNGISTSLGASV